MKGEDIIRIRNEGACAYDQMIRDHGYEAAKQMLVNRVGAKCSVIIKQEEWDKSITALQEAVANAYLTLVFTTLHDRYGWGSVRLKRFKDFFDASAAICYATDMHGKRYVTVRSCAEDMNRIADLGLDLETIWDTEVTSTSLSTRLASVDKIIGFLREHGQEKAAQMVWTECYGEDCEVSKLRTKEQREIAKKRRREDRKYVAPDMNLFDPEVSKGYLAVIASVLAESGMDADRIMGICAEVNNTLTRVLCDGQKIMDGILKNLEDEYEISFDV